MYTIMPINQLQETKLCCLYKVFYLISAGVNRRFLPSSGDVSAK